MFAWGALRGQRAYAKWCAARARADGVVSRVVERRVNGSFSEDAGGMPTDPASITVAVVSFRAANGVDYEFDTQEVPLEVGTAVAVAYDPALPSDARAIARTPKVGCAAILLLVGAALAIYGLTRS